MKRILIFHPYLAPYRIDLYNHLSVKYDLKVILTASKNEIETLGFNLDFVNSQAKFSYEYCENGFYIGRHLISSIYYKYINKFKPDVVIGHELGVNSFVSLIFKTIYNYKLLISIDDSPAMATSYSLFRKLLRNILVKFSDAMLVVHPNVKLHLSQLYSKTTNCNFIYFPIIQNDKILNDKFIDSVEAQSIIKENYNVRNKKIILFLGRLETVKNPELLLKAFEKVEQPDTILVFVGAGSLLSKMQNYCKSNSINDKVFFTGQLSGAELYAWYALADVFVLPSSFEPFGAVVNEALVAGCFVIVSDNVGANSLINEDNGLIVKANSEAELQRALKTSLTKISSKRYTKTNKMPFQFDELLEVLENQL